MKLLAALLAPALCLAVLAGAPPAAADDGKVIRLVVPFAAGGPTDAQARHLANGLQQRLGRSVVVENKPGAGGNLGAVEVARAAPDGTTILFGTSGPLAINVSLYRNLTYHPIDSFEPVVMVGALPNVLAVHPKVPARSLSELVAYARERPGRLFFASSGNGASSHLAGVLFNGRLGTEIKHVPYRGTGPALNDLIAGHVHMTFTDVLTAAPHIQAGTINAIGVTTLTRSEALPQVPTLHEQGLSQFDVSVFFGIVAPRNTPRAVIDQLNRAFVESMADPALAQVLREQGIIRDPDTRPERLTEVMRAEIDKWRAVVAASGAQLD